MRKLEIAARSAWAELGVNAREFVALGFEDPIDEYITWYELPNAASASASGGVGEFYVEPEVVRETLLVAQTEVDPSCMRLIWHSHYVAQSPSDADFALMRNNDWLDYGMVYHAPSGQTTVYNAAGIIRISEPIVAGSRDTQVDFGRKADSDRAPFYGGRDEDGM